MPAGVGNFLSRVRQDWRRPQDHRPCRALALELARRARRLRRLIMAAPGHVLTISRAAEILGQEEDLLWNLVDSLEPEDGCPWIYDD